MNIRLGTEGSYTDSPINQSNWETSIMDMCEKNANFLGWKFPVSNETREKIFHLFASDFGLLAPTNLVLLALSYTRGSWKWIGPKKSSFNAYTGETCGYNPLDDTYVLKLNYDIEGPCYVFNKLTNTKIFTLTDEVSCSGLDFDLLGNYYTAAFFEKKLCKWSKDNNVVWMKDSGRAVSVAYRRTDDLLYTCSMSGTIQVINPKDGSLIKSFDLPLDGPIGEMHPMKFIPMEVNGILEEVLIIHDDTYEEQDEQKSYGYCYLVTNNFLQFVHKFVFPFGGQGNYIYDSSDCKLLVCSCKTSNWFEYTFEM